MIIKINLLGGSKGAAGAGQIGELLEKIGLSDIDPEQIILVRGTLLKIALIFVAVYFISDIAVSMLSSQKEELDAQIDTQTISLGTLKTKLREKKGIRKEMDRIIQSENKLRRKLRVVSSLDTNRFRAFKILDSISLLIPPKVWILTIDLTSDKLGMKGASWEFLPINEFVSDLKGSELFQSVRLESISSSPAPKLIKDVPLALQKIKDFSVTMVLKSKKEVKKKGRWQKRRQER